MEILNSQSEWIELQAHRALYDSVSAELKHTLGFTMQNINGIECSVCSVEPSILINRCFVTDDEALKDVSAIQDVVRLYANAGVKEFFMHVPGSSSEARQNLEKAGMKKSRGWMKFKRDDKPATSRNPELAIREIGPEYAEDFARIVVPCFDLTEASIPLIASVVSHPDIIFTWGLMINRRQQQVVSFIKRVWRIAILGLRILITGGEAFRAHCLREE